jgi:hypothetical protein
MCRKELDIVDINQALSVAYLYIQTINNSR